MSKNYLQIFGKKKVFGIAGCTNSGKTTLAQALVGEFGPKTILLSQDEFYKSKNQVDEIRSTKNSNITFYNYDNSNSLNEKEMSIEILRLRNDSSIDFIIVEGSMITDLDSVFPLIDHTIFMVVSKNICRKRREKRIYDPPDEEGQFEEIVWPSYCSTLSRARLLADNSHNKNCLLFYQSADEFSNQLMEEIILRFRHLANDYIKIQSDCIPIETLYGIVNTPYSGAQSIFIGVTRQDVKNGKEVSYLEYEAYTAMAYEQLHELCIRIHKFLPEISKIAIFHRIGTVYVGDTSVAIAASSPHRYQAINATERLINELKHNIPIWKKEYTTDGNFSWKQNDK